MLCGQGECGSPRWLSTIPLPLRSLQTAHNSHVCEGLLGELALHHAELRATLSQHSLEVDHQCMVVKHPLGDDVVGHGRQTFTICGDFGLVCGVYVVPDTGLSWAKTAMTEFVE